MTTARPNGATGVGSGHNPTERWNIRRETGVYITEAATCGLNDEATGRFRRHAFTKAGGVS
jgi:hypothetical protein